MLAKTVKNLTDLQAKTLRTYVLGRVHAKTPGKRTLAALESNGLIHVHGYNCNIPHVSILVRGIDIAKFLEWI